MAIHSFLVIAPSVEETELLPKTVRSPSLDVMHIVGRRFGITEARSLRKSTEQKAISDSNRTFVIACNEMTVKAQNALLKLFEDPPPRTIFYLVVQSESLLLATLRSRMHLLRDTASTVSTELACTFLQSTYAERISSVADYIRKDTVDELYSIVRGVAELHRMGQLQLDTVALRAVAFVERTLRISGVSKKMLMEHLALVLPHKSQF